ncbi:hypothetical protein [Streptomyces silvisoli]|uniref:Uncharacterized protein n=1 Tax=Streptomyces silvisoli TaxID=3034235 RepID=A0ABT5ZL84_9ACTN|nr:hypothetical protein [Streptomyces silvisoli]MDF3290585.1 hypothetical protein [Streptomyces silvisoli]
MLTSRTWRRWAAAALGLTAVLLPAAATPAAAYAPPAAHHLVLPEPPPADTVRAELDALKVEAPHSMAGYSRAKFPHWIKQYGECDTREVVLSRDGQGVTRDAKCRAVSGTWYSPYDDKTLDSASTVHTQPEKDKLIAMLNTCD